MAYYSGVANSLANLKHSLLTSAQSDGWTLTGDVLSKAGVFFRILSSETNISCLGCADNAVSTPAPGVVQIGLIYLRSGYTTREITFPCSYEIFGFAQELYMVVNYDVDTYQWMAFGKSTVPGLSAHGGWCGATIGATIIGTSGSFTPNPIFINAGGAMNSLDVSGGGNYGNYSMTTAALFHGVGSGLGFRNWHLNAKLDGTDWLIGSTLDDAGVGVNPLYPLLAIQPSTWNSETTLLPMRAYATRPSNKLSMVADLDHARRVRVDNLSPGDILTIGPDKWKVFPWYRKDTAARNGGFKINHTGTFGWAIRYEGP